MSNFVITPAREFGVFDFRFPVAGKCSRGMHYCMVSVVHGAPVNHCHGWDGNTEAPTITPSIDCAPRGCTFHGHVSAGKVTP